jgi:hypothetical protein
MFTPGLIILHLATILRLSHVCSVRAGFWGTEIARSHILPRSSRNEVEATARAIPSMTDSHWSNSSVQGRQSQVIVVLRADTRLLSAVFQPLRTPCTTAGYEPSVSP